MSSFIRSTAIFLNSIIISLWIVPEDHEYVKNDTITFTYSPRYTKSNTKPVVMYTQ